jgi:recombination protein RecA
MHETAKRLLKDLQSQFGKDVIMTGADLNVGKKLRFWRIKTLNHLLGGGVPRSKLTEIFGPEDSGKTTLAYRLLAQVQREDGVPAYIDAEGQWDHDWAQQQGVDPANMILVRPVSAEAMLEAVVQLVKQHVPLVIFDSIAAQESLKVHEGDMDVGAMADIPRLLNRCVRKCLVLFRTSPTSLVFLNQVRERVVRGRPLYGDFLTTTGGRGIRHFAHLRLEVVRTRYLTARRKKDTIRVGQVVAVRVQKSKVSKPGGHCELILRYGEGFVT